MKKFIVVLVILVAMNVNAQWEPDTRLTNSQGNSYTPPNNAWGIAANGNVVHTVWYDNRDGNWEIYYKRSTSSGINWGPDTRLTNNTAWSVSSAIAVSGNIVHVAWYDNRDGNAEIYYKRSSDGGITWGADTRLTNNTAYSEYPSIAVSGSVVHISWSDYRYGSWQIYYKRSTDGGMNWEVDTPLTSSYSASSTPSIAVSGSLVHVVWHDGRDDYTEIYYKRSTDDGINWGADTRLTNNAGYSWYPSIALSGTLAHVVWADDRNNNWDIYYKRSTDGGTNWGADTRLSNNIFSGSPSIAVSSSFVHVVWHDGRDSDYEIYYKLSTDGGINWGADTRLSNTPVWSVFPSIAVSGAIIHVVWKDERDGNPEIYYKRNPTGNVGIQYISTEIPSKYSLSQNYPNPFNPVTKIRFDVPSVKQASLFVNLKVFDITSREIQTLVNESLKPGTYEATFDGSKLNSGVYFYKMTAGNYSETKKMLLIK